MPTGDYIGGLLKKARRAQKEYESYNQAQVDEVVMTISKSINDNAEILAQLAVEETGMGVVEDKILKNRMKAQIIWNSLKGKKSAGIIDRNDRTGITEIAKPMGVVAAITPMTNPIVTPMSNAMFALKGRNAIIISPHHKSVRSSGMAIRLINEALDSIGAPKDLIQIIDNQSRENTRLLLEGSDIVIATGGAGMVKAAYSSGKPALGVGAGNVQCIIDSDADIEDAVQLIVRGRAFDNGIICAAEQSAIVPKSRYNEVLEEFRKNKAVIITDREDIKRLTDTLFVFGSMNKDVIGQSAAYIARMAGIEIPGSTRIIVAESTDAGGLLGREKMCPVLALYQYDDFEDAVRIAGVNLEMEGKGHSVAIHSNTPAHIEYAGLNLAVSRFVINQCSATSAGGSFYNGFAPTNTLGCGSWGGNSISENLDYKHLINISRIGYFMKDGKVPTEDELWGLRGTCSQ